MRFGKTVKFKINFFMSLIIIIVMTMYGFYYYNNMRKQEFNDIALENNQIIERLAFSLVNPLWNLQNIDIEKTINIEMRNENILAIILVSSDDELIFGLIKDKDWKPQVFMQNEKQTTALQNHYKKYKSPIVKQTLRPGLKENAYVLGEISVYVTDYFIKKSLEKVVVRIIIQTLSLMFFCIIFLYLILNWVFLKRLRVIDKHINELQLGNYNSVITIQGADELSNIAKNFNTMSKTILKRQQQLIVKNKKIIELQHYLSNIIESMPSMLISLENDGTINQWNAAASKITGVPSIDVIGKRIWDIFPSFNQKRKYYKYFSQVVGSHQSIELRNEKLLNDKDKYFNVTFYPLTANGTNGIVLRIDDVTELEKKEQQLRQAQKMEIVGNLAGGLAHDFNNVLGGIIGTISLLKYKVDKREVDFESFDTFIKIIDESGQRASEMVKQLLTLSRKSDLTFAPISIEESINHVIKICNNTFDKSVEIIYQPDKELNAVVNADKTQLGQVFLNLCINASHAMTFMRKKGQKAGGKLYIAYRKIVADKHFCSSHPEAEEIQYWNISVRDTGVGMDKKTLSKIFDPFFTTKEKGHGTGLGLAMVYNIIQQHNGFIDVYSEIDLGTTFNIYLPALLIEDINIGKNENASICKGTGRILLVDDEDIIRLTAKSILEECGYHVILAENGEEGVRVFKQSYQEIDLVLLDMVMPKKSGKEAFIEMKKIFPDLKVILASGFKQDKRVESVLSLGIKDFIQKPYTMQELCKKVKKVLQNNP